MQLPEMLENKTKKLFFPDKIHIVKCLSYNEYSNYTKKDVEGVDFVITNDYFR